MSAKTWCVVYNGGESAQVVSEEGKTVYPRDFACARRSEVRDLIDGGYLRVVDPDTITDSSTDAARMAKQEAEAQNDRIDAEKAKDEKEEKNKPDSKPTRSASSQTTSSKSHN
jgi:hypothetical protein